MASRAMMMAVAVLSAGLGLHCGGGDEELSAEEMRQQVIDNGQHCCFDDGEPTTEECAAKTRAGSVWIEEFSNLDRSGRGEICGWVWDGR